MNSAPPPIDQPIADIKTGKLGLAWANYFLTNYQNVEDNTGTDALFFLDSPLSGQNVEDISSVESRDALGEVYAGQERVAIESLESRTSLNFGYAGQERAAIEELESLMALSSGYAGQERGAIESIESRLALIQESGSSSQNAAPWVLVGTHADRVALFAATSYQEGTLYYETDRKVFYIVAPDTSIPPIKRWFYASGVYRDLSANRPSDLGIYDGGFQFQSSDHYGMTWAWTVAAGPTTFWKYAGGQDIGLLANIATAGGVGALGGTDIGLLYFAQDVGHLFEWQGGVWDFAAGDCLAGWTTFANTVPSGDVALWQAIAPGGGNAAVTQSNGTSVVVAFGAWTSPIVGGSMWVRV